jgi:phosphoglycerate kinase
MILPDLESLGNLSGKRVLVRADLNVPLDWSGDEAKVADDFRIRATLPTLVDLTERGAQVVVCSHLGRPKGHDSKYSMEPVAKVLKQHLPSVTVLENLRFDPREKANVPSFARELANGCDFYVNDAFGACHRAHASIVGVPAILPSAAGINLQLEVERLSVLLENPKQPYVAIIGGAKVSDKLSLITSLLGKVDHVLIGGGMCFTFWAAQGKEIGDSLFEPDRVDECRRLLESGKVIVPTDVLGLRSEDTFGRDGGADEPKHFKGSVPVGHRGLDIGPETVDTFRQVIMEAASILWNGPMGVFEDPRFSKGTFEVARYVADAKAYSVVGGGDSAAALRMAGLADRVSHLSTGGGASLEFIEKGDLPGLEALRNSPRN